MATATQRTHNEICVKSLNVLVEIVAWGGKQFISYCSACCVCCRLNYICVSQIFWWLVWDLWRQNRSELPTLLSSRPNLTNLSCVCSLKDLWQKVSMFLMLESNNSLSRRFEAEMRSYGRSRAAEWNYWLVYYVHTLLAWNSSRHIHTTDTYRTHHEPGLNFQYTYSSAVWYGWEKASLARLRYIAAHIERSTLLLHLRASKRARGIAREKTSIFQFAGKIYLHWLYAQCVLH